MLIFKKIEKAIYEINKNLVMYNTIDDNYNFELEKLNALRDIFIYVKKFNWLTRVDAKNKVRAVLNSKYNYKQVAKNFGVSVNSLQVTMSYASRVLEKKIGVNTVDLILKGDVEVGMLQFKTGIGDISIDGFLIKGVSDLLPDFNYSVYVDILDCRKEIDFLKSVTVKNLLRVKSSLDDGKLAFLKYILSTTDERYVYERGILLKYILGEINSYTDFISLMSSVNLYSGSSDK